MTSFGHCYVLLRTTDKRFLRTPRIGYLWGRWFLSLKLKLSNHHRIKAPPSPLPFANTCRKNNKMDTQSKRIIKAYSYTKLRTKMLDMTVPCRNHRNFNLNVQRLQCVFGWGVFMCAVTVSFVGSPKIRHGPTKPSKCIACDKPPIGKHLGRSIYISFLSCVPF